MWDVRKRVYSAAATSEEQEDGDDDNDYRRIIVTHSYTNFHTYTHENKAFAWLTDSMSLTYIFSPFYSLFFSHSSPKQIDRKTDTVRKRERETAIKGGKEKKKNYHYRFATPLTLTILLYTGFFPPTPP